MTPKELLIIGGPNGAGKTTIALECASQKSWQYLSADAIAESLSPGNPTASRFAAGVEFTHRLNHALSNDESLIVESTLAGRTIEKKIGVAKESGFSITIIFVYLDSPDVCIARVRERVKKGGHDVPDEDVLRRFRRSITNFWAVYRSLAEHWQLIYNSGERPVEVAIGKQADVTVRDAAKFVHFQSLVEGNRNG